MDLRSLGSSFPPPSASTVRPEGSPLARLSSSVSNAVPASPPVSPASEDGFDRAAGPSLEQIRPLRQTHAAAPTEIPGPPRPIREACIIGAGPGGLASAIKLAERGIKVQVVELRTADYQRPHHLNLRQGALHSLADLGVYDAVMQDSGWLIAEEERGVTHTPRPLEGDEGRVAPDPVTLLRSQSVVQVRISDVERALYHRARELGVEFAFHTTAVLQKVTDETSGDAQYRVQLQPMRQQNGTWEADGPARDVGVPDLVVVSDGANSQTRAQLGIDMVAETAPRYYLGGHFETGIGPLTRKVEGALPDGSVQRLMATGHAVYPSTWVSVEVPASVAEAPAQTRIDWLCEGASTVLGQPVSARDIAWGAGEVTRVQNRHARHVTAGRNVVLLGDAARTGDVWTGGGLNLSITTDVQNLCKLVDQVNDFGRDVEGELARYAVRTQWASRTWHTVASTKQRI